MKCYYDPTQEAIGCCKSCGKGLSQNYIVDLGKGLACKDRCEDDVKNLIQLIDRNIELSKTSENLLRGSGKGGYATALFLMSAGFVFLVFGIIKNFDIFLTVLGLIFIVFGSFNIFRAVSISKTLQARNKSE